MKPSPVDWNLEVAHVNWALPNAGDSVAESIADAKDYIAGWTSRGERYVVCILVDDKELRIPDRAEWLRTTRRDYQALFEMLDYVCFESDLVKLKDEFLKQLRPNQRGRIGREIERYRRKHGRVACSHDITIWHLLRLGLLASGNKSLHRVSTKRSPNAARLGFYARSALSILEEDDRAAEERAQEILKYCKNEDVLSRLEIVYYA